MAQITKRTTTAGQNRYDVRTRIAGRVITRTFNRRRDAMTFAATTEADKLRGVIVDPRGPRTPFETVSQRWLTASTAKRASSIARDRAIIENHLLPVLGSRGIGSITKADVQALVDRWAGTHAASTVLRQYSCLRAIFAYAESDDLIARTPCRGIRLPGVRLVERPALTAEQLDNLAAALGPDQSVMMWVGTVLGLRWAEAAGLAVGHLDLGQGQVTVARQLTRAGELTEPKSQAGRRTLACPTWLIDDLAALLGRRGLTPADNDALVFVSPEGSPLSYTNWRRRTWVPACDAAGLPGLRFHDLRSLSATALVAAGVDIKTAQTRLGHSSPHVTLALYARATKEADRLAADTVGEVFRPRDRRAMGAGADGGGSETI